VGQVAQMVVKRSESGHGLAVELERRHPIRDALLCLGHDFEDRLSQRLQRASLRLVERREVPIDVSFGHGLECLTRSSERPAIATDRQLRVLPEQRREVFHDASKVVHQWGDPLADVHRTDEDLFSALRLPRARRRHVPMSATGGANRPPRFLRWANAGLMRGLERGRAPAFMRLLTVRGRLTGEPHATPVVPVMRDGVVWIVSP
jgi:hypothetical protein